MEIEDTLSAVANRQIIDLQKRFESRLDFTGNGYLRSKDADFLPDFLHSSSEPKKDVQGLLDNIGLHLLVSPQDFAKLSSYHQSLVICRLCQVAKIVPQDLAMLLIYDFFIRVLRVMDMPTSIEKAAEAAKQLDLELQELKATSTQKMNERRKLFENVQISTDNPVYRIIQYIIENKLLERKLSQEKVQEHHDQLLGVKAYPDRKVYKYYRADTGKILYIQKKGDDGSEEELSQFDDAEFDLQIAEMGPQVQPGEEKAKDAGDQYKPDPEQLVRELHVCVPYGER